MPQIFLPTKVTIKVKPDSISIKLFYVLDETVTEIVNETKRVLIGKGVNSGRIFYIKASLDKARFATLLNRMQDVRSALKAQRNESKSEVQRKNYELILSLMDRTIQLASQSKDEIEKIFTS